MVYGRTPISYPLVTLPGAPENGQSTLRRFAPREARRGGRNRVMTNIVVLIKQVPDTWSERKLTDGDFQYWSPLPPEWNLITDQQADFSALRRARAAGALSITTA